MTTRESKFHFDNCYIEAPRQYGCVALYQLGDRLCQEGAQVPAHQQVCHEISCVISGTGRFFHNGQGYRVRAGDLFISPLGSLHKILSSRHDPLRYSYCGFMLDPLAGPEEFAQLPGFFAGVKEPLAPDRHSSVRQVFSLLLNELLIDDSSSWLLVKGQLEQLLLLTRRCYQAGAAPGRQLSQGEDFRQRLVYDVINYIDNNLLGISKLTDISAQTGYSYSYVAQTFAAVTGGSLGSYYQHRRFEKAVELLGRSNSVTQVSQALGFDSVQSFSRFFRKSCGTPPSQYLRGRTGQETDPAGKGAGGSG